MAGLSLSNRSNRRRFRSIVTSNPFGPGAISSVSDFSNSSSVSIPMFNGDEPPDSASNKRSGNWEDDRDESNENSELLDEEFISKGINGGGDTAGGSSTGPDNTSLNNSFAPMFKSCNGTASDGTSKLSISAESSADGNVPKIDWW